MTDYAEIPTRLAAALLLKRGEISLTEIEALPLVDNVDFALAIADVLAQSYRVTRYERVVDQSPSQFEDVIRLAPLPRVRPKNKPAPTGTSSLVFN